MDVLQDLAAAAGVELDDGRCRRQSVRRARRSRSGSGCSARWTAAAFFEDAIRVGRGRRRARLRREARHRRPGARALPRRLRAGRLGRAVVAPGAHKIPASDLERLGLVGVNERGRYDFFRDRVMLPVIDRQKRVIGFGGRLLDPDAKDRKYVNSPSRRCSTRRSRCTGCTRRWTRSAGAAAPSSSRGTSTCWRCTRRASRRGRADGHGADRGADRAARQAREDVSSCSTATRRASARRRRRCRCSWTPNRRRVARLPAGRRPRRLRRRRGPAAFRRLVEGARPMLDQFIQDVACDTNVPDRVGALRTIAALLVKVKDQTDSGNLRGAARGNTGVDPSR